MVKIMVKISEIAAELKTKILDSNKWLSMKTLVTKLKNSFNKTFTAESILRALVLIPGLKIQIIKGAFCQTKRIRESEKVYSI